jgi:hypothetical protein
MALPAGVAMNQEANLDDVEVLLSQTRRRACRCGGRSLYLNPFALFKDAARISRGCETRAQPRQPGCCDLHQRYVLMAAVFFLGIAPAEALAAEASILIIPAAAAAVGCCIALSVAACAWVGYVLLGARARK